MHNKKKKPQTDTGTIHNHRQEQPPTKTFQPTTSTSTTTPLANKPPFQPQSMVTTKPTKKIKHQKTLAKKNQKHQQKKKKYIYIYIKNPQTQQSKTHEPRIPTVIDHGTVGTSWS